MAIAHLINSGASVEVMESLADEIGHSPQMQQKIYSRHALPQHSTLALDAQSSDFVEGSGVREVHYLYNWGCDRDSKA
jgi:hypothetical protein